MTFPSAVVDVPAPGRRPDRLLSIGDAVVALRDASTGTTLEELAVFPSLVHSAEGPGPNQPRDVALSLDGRTAWYVEGPEPACGSVSEVATTEGAVPESRGDGNHVTAGPAGYFVTSGGCGVRIRKGGTVLASVDAPSGESFGVAAWSPDGRVIATEHHRDTGPPVIVVFDLIAGHRSEIRDPDGLGYRVPAFRNDGRLVVVQQPGDDASARAKVVDVATGGIVGEFSYGGVVVDQAYDATSTWLLVTMADGLLRWFGGGDQGDLGRAYANADW